MTSNRYRASVDITDLKEMIDLYSKKEQRSMAQMLRILLQEALEARCRKAEIFNASENGTYIFVGKE